MLVKTGSEDKSDFNQHPTSNIRRLGFRMHVPQRLQGATHAIFRESCTSEEFRSGRALGFGCRRRSSGFVRCEKTMFDNIRGDFHAHGSDWGAQGFWVMIVYRFGRWRYGVRPAVLRKFFSLIYRILYKLTQVVTGIELPCEAEVGRNFVIDHFGTFQRGRPG